jgi:hypothetical protein
MGLKMIAKALGLPEGATLDDVIAALKLPEGSTIGDVLAAVVAALDASGGAPAPEAPKVPASAPAPEAPKVPASAPAPSPEKEEEMVARIAANVATRMKIDAAPLTPLEKSLLSRATPAEAEAYIAQRVKANATQPASVSVDEAAIAAVAKATGLPVDYVKGAK